MRNNFVPIYKLAEFHAKLYLPCVIIIVGFCFPLFLRDKRSAAIPGGRQRQENKVKGKKRATERYNNTPSRTFNTIIIISRRQNNKCAFSYLVWDRFFIGRLIIVIIIVHGNVSTSATTSTVENPLVRAFEFRPGQ